MRGSHPKLCKKCQQPFFFFLIRPPAIFPEVNAVSRHCNTLRLQKAFLRILEQKSIRT